MGEEGEEEDGIDGFELVIDSSGLRVHHWASRRWTVARLTEISSHDCIKEMYTNNGELKGWSLPETQGGLTFLASLSLFTSSPIFSLDLVLG